MENNFIQQTYTVDNVNLLLDQNFTEKKSAIFNPKDGIFILVNNHARTFWLTCHEGLQDAQQIIKEMFNQKITTQCQN